MRKFTRGRKHPRKTNNCKNDVEVDMVSDFAIKEIPKEVNLTNKNLFEKDEKNTSWSMSSISQRWESVCSSERDIVCEMQ